jgi:peptide/nickel transport system substrate-binding protein
MKRSVRPTVLLAALTAAATAACSGGQAVDSGSAGTFTLGVSTDPGGLDPQRSEQQANLQVAALAYNSAVTLDQARHLQPGIVTKWQNDDPTTWTLTVRAGVSCSDGSTMDAKTVADNLNYVANPANGSAYAGTTIPSGSTATANGGTVRVTLPAPSPFLIENLALLPLVCEKGLADRSSLAATSDGTGPYTIQSVAPGAQITYALRKDFTPGLAGNQVGAGLPATIVVKIVSDATTTANLLLGGQLNGAIVTGTDQKRLTAAGLRSTGLNVLSDQIYFNHAAGNPTSDANVRKALVMGLDMRQVVAAVTGGLGATATGLLATPKVCPGDPLGGNLPAFSPDKARASLAQAGWRPGPDGVLAKDGKPLTIALAYSSDVATSSSAAQVVQSEWHQIGAQVTLVGKPAAQLTTGVLGATLAWDALLFDLGFATPAQMGSFVSGTPAPKGQNFSGIDNETYNSLTAKAATQPGTSGCADWNAAEAALFSNADVAPTGQAPFQYFAKNATFDVSGFNQILPTSIQLH